MFKLIKNEKEDNYKNREAILYAVTITIKMPKICLILLLGT